MIATIATVLAAVGAGGIISAIVTAIINKKKTGAEAAELITRAATGTVENFQKIMNRMTEDMDELVTAQREERERHREEISRIARAIVLEREESREVLAKHVAWDSAAVAELNDHGLQVGPVPPLLPSKHHFNGQGLPIDW